MWKKVSIRSILSGSIELVSNNTGYKIHAVVSQDLRTREERWLQPGDGSLRRILLNIALWWGGLTDMGNHYLADTHTWICATKAIVTRRSLALWIVFLCFTFMHLSVPEPFHNTITATALDTNKSLHTPENIVQCYTTVVSILIISLIQTYIKRWRQE